MMRRLFLLGLPLLAVGADLSVTEPPLARGPATHAIFCNTKATSAAAEP